MQLITIHELVPGMILAQEVVSNNFINIASEGTIITTEIIDRLMNMGIDFVYVKAELNKVSDNLQRVDNPIFKSLESKEALNYHFNKTIDIVKDIFNNLKIGVVSIKTELEGTIDPLIDGVLVTNNILKSLRTMEYDSDYTLKHSINVGLLSASIGKWIGLSDKDITDLATAGILHDIGKSKIPKYILNKPAILSEQEFGIAKRHAEYGKEILKDGGEYNNIIIEGVLYHHERYDGSGYPYGLIGDEIPLFGRIIAIADVFDALISDKVYRKKISPFEAADVLKHLSFEKLDPKITNIFLKKLSEFYVGNKVILSTGEEAEIVYLNKYNITRPLVRVNNKFIDLSTITKITIYKVL